MLLFWPNKQGINKAQEFAKYADLALNICISSAIA